jgi:hypothetical protein
MAGWVYHNWSGGCAQAVEESRRRSKKRMFKFRYEAQDYGWWFVVWWFVVGLRVSFSRKDAKIRKDAKDML